MLGRRSHDYTTIYVAPRGSARENSNEIIYLDDQERLRLAAPAWQKTATATLSLTSTELSQNSYVLGYLCTWTGSTWKGGCRDSACTQSYWQRQSFKR